MIYVWLFLKTFFLGNVLIGNEMATLRDVDRIHCIERLSAVMHSNTTVVGSLNALYTLL